MKAAIALIAAMALSSWGGSYILGYVFQTMVSGECAELSPTADALGNISVPKICTEPRR
jgi:hypothetical protein